MTDKPYPNPKKSAYSVEFYQSDPEGEFMRELESNEKVTKWTKNHGIRIPYFNFDGKLAHYTPDFLIEYEDGSQEIVEIKGSHMMTKITQLKTDAAREWCKKRNIKYKLIEV
ncbi:MAG: TnsA endonuclease N-terminal domain-containing protein [Thermoplasmatales archaeon]